MPSSSISFKYFSFNPAGEFGIGNFTLEDEREISIYKNLYMIFYHWDYLDIIAPTVVLITRKLGA